MEEKDLRPPVPTAGMQLGVNFLEVKGGLQEAFKNMGDAMTSEETVKETIKSQQQDPQR